MEIDAISRFLAPITVGFIAAVLGSVLALNKFKKEKVWDERRGIYREVIESFEEVLFWCEYIRARHYCEPVIESNASLDEPLRKISKYSVSGGFFLSTEFQQLLEQANAELYRVRFQVSEESSPDLDTEQGRQEWLFILAKEIDLIVKKHLPMLISIAKNELPK